MSASDRLTICSSWRDCLETSRSMAWDSRQDRNRDSSIPQSRVGEVEVLHPAAPVSGLFPGGLDRPAIAREAPDEPLLEAALLSALRPSACVQHHLVSAHHVTCIA